jgi:hypothetical protein
MSFFVTNTSKEFVLVPPGSHLARCYRIVDLGSQKSEYMGRIKQLRKIMIGWEIHGEAEDGTPLLTDKGEPMAIFKNYTHSWGENSTLRKDLQSWRGKPWTDQEAEKFDIERLLNQWCMLNVIHRPGQNNKIYANVDSVTPVHPIIKQRGFPEGFNDVQVFNLETPDWELFETFSQGLKTKIENSPEFKALRNPGEASAPSKGKSLQDLDDDIPF